MIPVLIPCPELGRSLVKEYYEKRSKIAKIIYDEARAQGIEDVSDFVPWSKARVKTKEMYYSIADKVMPEVKIK